MKVVDDTGSICDFTMWTLCNDIPSNTHKQHKDERNNDTLENEPWRSNYLRRGGDPA